MDTSLWQTLSASPKGVRLRESWLYINNIKRDDGLDNTRKFGQQYWRENNVWKDFVMETWSGDQSK